MIAAQIKSGYHFGVVGFWEKCENWSFGRSEDYFIRWEIGLRLSHGSCEENSKCLL